MFSKANKIAQAYRASALTGQVQFVVFEKIVQVLIYSKLQEKNYVITYNSYYTWKNQDD